MHLPAYLFRAPRSTDGKSFYMKPLLTLLLVTWIGLANTQAQTITLSLDNAPLETVFKSIKIQTSYNFVYTREQMLIANKVSIHAKDQSLQAVLAICFRNQPLTYSIEDKYVVVQEKKTNAASTVETFTVQGKVTDESGSPLAAATISIKPSGKVYATSDDGSFNIGGIDKGSLILFANIGYEPRQLRITSAVILHIELSPAVKSLDETFVIAYGTTTRRLSTGSVEKVSKDEIEKQPVTNVLNALHGRVAGLTVVQQNGIPGAAVKIQIRGRTSINSAINNDPLIIIDGVPFAPNNNSINQVGSALGNAGLSPLNAINPSDIQSIEVLRDADATAIYGSRGANGVILITTKKGKAGKTKFEANLRTGFSRITRTLPFMNTRQYVAMRKEAFANDGLTPSANPGSAYAPDLTIWDTTAYTDLSKLLTGGTAMMTDAQLRLSGGSTQTQFSIGAGYSRQTTVFPGDMFNDKFSFHTSLDHRSPDQKFSLGLKTNYVFDNNNITASDLSGNLRLPPNIPALYNSEGKLNWEQGGVGFDNPMAYLQRKYNSKIHNLIASLQLNYQFTKDLQFRSSLGFNSVGLDDKSVTPISAQNPANAPLGTANFGNNDFSSFIVEPQLQYKKKLGAVKIDVQGGGSWQTTTKKGMYLSGTGYTGDAMIHSLRGAAAVTVLRNDELHYKYAALFARTNINVLDKYTLNVTARRDGSSRFGPGKRYANFGAAGFAWIFSREKFVSGSIPALSFGKLRGSYGTTGNDKIGDYAYLNTYSSTGLSYQGIPGITPTTLFNPDYAWELNKKFELALELGLFRDRLQFSAAYYNNKSSNQLINYALPSQTGGQSIIRNFPATVVNSGYEIEVRGTPFINKDLEWTTSLNITMPKNKLKSFPGFESSSYFSTLMIGEPLNIAGGYRFAGVSAVNGVYEFYDKDGKTTTTPKAADRVKNLVRLDPVFYGGFSSDLRYKGWSLDVFFEFRKQTGQNYFGNVYSNISYPGMMFNMPARFMNRWRSPGDETSIGRFIRGAGSPAYTTSSVMTLNGSDALYGDASYLRLKNLSLSYDLPDKIARRAAAQDIRVYLQAQNLLTITRYEGADPETQNVFTLPPLRTITGGIRFTF